MVKRRKGSIAKTISLLAAFFSIAGVIWTIFLKDNPDSFSFIKTKGDVRIEFYNYTVNEYQSLNIEKKDLTDEQAVNISYSAEQGVSGFSSLLAEINNQTYVLIDTTAELCLNIIEQKDFDSNKTCDVLVENVTACGGNCCGNSYFFYTYLGNGHFVKTEEFGYAWTEPVVEQWKGLWTVNVTSENEGSNTDKPLEIKERFTLDEYMIVKLEESTRMTIRAVTEITSGMYDINNPEETKKLIYDLNSDGANDTIITSFWPRWGRMFWEVHFADGKTYSSGTGAKRIGILKTKTNGYSDLVLDQDGVLRWNGEEYR